MARPQEDMFLHHCAARHRTWYNAGYSCRLHWYNQSYSTYSIF